MNDRALPAQTAMSTSDALDRLREGGTNSPAGGTSENSSSTAQYATTVDRVNRETAGLGRPTLPVDVRFRGDVGPSTGGLLSIAQLQSELRARTSRTGITAAAGSPPSPLPLVRSLPSAAQSQAAQGQRPQVVERAEPGTDEPGLLAPESVTSIGGDGNWLLVVAAQPGVGCSTTALAVADAAGQTGSRVHLVEAAVGGHASLAAVTCHELGVVDGGWRRGRRGPVVLDRPDGTGVRVWPPSPPVAAGQVPLLVLDAGPAWAFPGADPEGGSAWWRARAAAPAAVVVVCRATVPGVTSAERALYELTELHRSTARTSALPPVLIAALGGARWRGAVGAACGPHLHEVLAQHRVVGVPRIRHLELNGPTAAPLPRALAASGRALWSQINATRVRGGGLR